MLGRAAGRHIHALAHNRDPRRVQPRRRRRSIGSQRALGRRRRSADELDAILVGLVDRVTGRMRRAGRVGRTVVLRLRFDDFARVTRSHTMSRPTAGTQAILSPLRGLLAGAMPLVESQGLTLLGITVTNLENANAIQLVLPFDADRRGALDEALDDVRDRFGTSAVTRAVLLHRDQGIEVPLLPD
jgi:DNA polymerase-4